MAIDLRHQRPVDVRRQAMAERDVEERDDLGAAVRIFPQARVDRGVQRLEVGLTAMRGFD